MQISLRQASALQDEIKNLIKDLKLSVSARFDEFSDVPEELTKLINSFNENKVRFEKLVDILGEIRQKVGSSNESLKVNYWLVKLNCLDILLNKYNRLISDVEPLNMDLLIKKIERMSDPEYNKTIYHSKLDSSILTEEDIISFNKVIMGLKKEKQKINDKLIHINVGNFIELDEESVIVLTSEGLL